MGQFHRGAIGDYLVPAFHFVSRAESILACLISCVFFVFVFRGGLASHTEEENYFDGKISMIAKSSNSKIAVVLL